jgi:hypothetical protein
VLDRVVGAPDAQLERPLGVIDRGVGEGAELQRLSRGEDEVVEGADALEEGRERLLVEKVDDVALGGAGQLGKRRLDALLGRRGDDDRGALGRRRLRGRQAETRGAAEDRDALVLESH